MFGKFHLVKYFSASFIHNKKIKLDLKICFPSPPYVSSLSDIHTKFGFIVASAIFGYYCHFYFFVE